MRARQTTDATAMAFGVSWLEPLLESLSRPIDSFRFPARAGRGIDRAMSPIPPEAGTHKTPTTGKAALPPHAVLNSLYPEASQRSRFVRELFDLTASDYDRLSGFLSFGTDQWYRRRVLRQAGLRAGMKLLDVATGTGLLLQAARKIGCREPDIVGMDPSSGMMGMNPLRGRVFLVRGCGEQLPFRSAQFDFVTMGYALRHVEDLRLLFSEIRRVLRQRGRVLLMEISRPQSSWMERLMKFHFTQIVPRSLGFLRCQSSPRLMQFYWETIRHCVPAPAITQALTDTGFADVQARRTGPVLTNYLAVKS